MEAITQIKSTISAGVAALGKPPGPPPGPQALQASRRDHFTDELRGSFEKLNAIGASSDKDLRGAANQLVSMAFVKPLLAQARQSPFKNDLFHGGQGETIFQEHLDSVLADRITDRTNLSIADAVYRKFAGRSMHALDRRG